MGAVWAYIILFTFVGPEMSQEERNEEAALTLEFEEMRAQGVSLLDIGVGRAKLVGSEEEVAADQVDEKGAVRYIEEA